MLVIRGACDASVYLGSAQSPVSFGLYSSLDRKRKKKSNLLFAVSFLFVFI